MEASSCGVARRFLMDHPNVRIIARLDIKGPNLIKGVHLEGLRVMGDPNQFAIKYYEQGADEIIYMDTVASLYQRKHIKEIIRHTAKNVFIPITVGGGVRSVDDVRELLRVGADKVAVNTAAVQRPELIREISQTFGSQCMVLSVEAKETGSNRWEVYTDNGREHTGLEVQDWVHKAVCLGAGEILLTSVDREGTEKGFDLNLVNAVCQKVSVPVIASGGMGTVRDLASVVGAGANAVAIASLLHYNKMSLSEIKKEALGLLKEKKIRV